MATDTAALIQQYRDHLAARPKREEHKLGTGGNILALLAAGLTGATQGAGAGINTGLAIKDRPYRQAMKDWESGSPGLAQLIQMSQGGDALSERARQFDTSHELSKDRFEADKELKGRGLDLREKSFQHDLAQQAISNAMRTRGLDIQEAANKDRSQRGWNALELSNRRASARDPLSEIQAVKGQQQIADWQYDRELQKAALNPAFKEFIIVDEETGIPIGIKPFESNWFGDDTNRQTNYTNLKTLLGLN